MKYEGIVLCDAQLSTLSEIGSLYILQLQLSSLLTEYLTKIDYYYTKHVEFVKYRLAKTQTYV